MIMHVTKMGEPEMAKTESSENGVAQSEEITASEHKSHVRKKKALRARYAYGVGSLETMEKGYCLCCLIQKPVGQRSKNVTIQWECFESVLDVLYPYTYLNCNIFFFIMFLTTANTRKLHEVRHTWHSGWWGLKFILLLISFMIPFFIPSDYIQLYGELARVGAGIFLILQLISVIEFITWWNNYWMSDDRKKSSCSIGLFMSTVFYISSVCGIAVMYVFYASKTSCTLNIFFISWTGVLLIVMMAISLHSKVNRGLLSSGIMASYIVFLCWTAIRSEPGSEKCSPQKPESGHIGWPAVVGFVVALCAIVIATFSTGIDSQSFQLRKNGSKLLEDDIPYGYGFFHLVFSLGAMYFAMLFISWNLGSLTRKWSIDVGWASTWVKIVNEWFAATIYLWKLIFPVLKETKVSNHDEESTEQV
ncbi:serinc-domain containing serine and sphingolipidbiosynthesis protein [Striga asiatica]|uniref:Serinc-domain containing serine and sphingolipidbiosynthesis protein n=1 Tax=Striga asiatica TaxID=4170 RepID=A0A5A7PF74_STRAF|nr:serinc-domain containing serine and sphingolipidbiosynthesis protein [Striga asiatica]